VSGQLYQLNGMLDEPKNWFRHFGTGKNLAAAAPAGI
jgi:hypothetical protein